MATRQHHYARTTPELRQITVHIDHERSLTPQQQAAWDWFVQEVHRRLARDPQATAGTSEKDRTP